jgi:myo-inositol 2-dehydrogenase/D-chiro-inositol 1-dehydrogenase
MIKVGVIGTGVMGAGHARFINQHVKNAEVVGISDVNVEGMKKLADDLGTIKIQTTDPEELAKSPEIDALLIASPDQFHASQIRLALKYKKPTLCEKPLASTLEDARAITKEIDEAEAAVGKKLINIGFMRRFDPGFVKVKTEVESGKYGKPLYVRVVSRNHFSPGTTSEGILINSAVHDFDIYRWMFNSEWESVQPFHPRHTDQAPEDVKDPLIFIATMKNGIILMANASANGAAGYDTRAEVVCETGSIEIGPFGDVAVRTLDNYEANHGGKMEINWMKKFEQAYINELQAWADELETGVVNNNFATHKDALIANETAQLGVNSFK